MNVQGSVVVVVQRVPVAEPHFLARQSLVEVPDDDHGSIVMPAVAPPAFRDPRRVRWAGPLLGQHADEVLQSAGLAAADIAKVHTGVT